MDIEIQWGGYYASRDKEDDEFTVFRLLDFNRSTYHVALFKEKFVAIPTLEEVMRLSPYIGHVPIDSKALLRPRDVHLLGGSPLTEADLEGYRFYLEYHEMEEREIKQLLSNVIEFCSEPPLRLTLALRFGVLHITKR